MDRREQLRAPLLASATALALAAAAWPFTVDDAFIVARFAENLASGGGYGVNPGMPADGVTGPLWLLPLVAGASFGVDVVALAKGLGILTMAAAVFEATRRARVRHPIAAAGMVASAALASSAYVWAGAGLETGVATLCLTLAGLECVRGDGPRAGILLPCLFFLPWLRPECLPIAMTLVALSASRGAGVGAGLSLAFGVVTVVGFRWVLFDSFLPLAAFAKPVGLYEGLPYVLEGVLRLTGIVGLVSVGVGVVRGDAGRRALGLGLLAHLLAVAVAGGDWMPGHRLLVPIVPLAALLAGEGLESMASRGHTRAAGVMVAITTLVLSLDGVVELPAARGAGSARELVGGPLAEELGARSERVALVDIGYLGRRGGFEVVDLGGITDPLIGRAEGGYLDKEIDPAYLAARDPDAILLHAAAPPGVDEEGRLTSLAAHGVERRVAAMPWVRERFRVREIIAYSPGYFYVWLERRP